MMQDSKILTNVNAQDLLSHHPSRKLNLFWSNEWRPPPLISPEGVLGPRRPQAPPGLGETYWGQKLYVMAADPSSPD